MNPLEAFRLAFDALRAQRRRTLLSLLGMAIGVASVVVLTGLGAGARAYVNEQFLTIGSNIIAVIPGKVETSGALPGFGGVPNDLTLDDAEALVRSVPAVYAGSPLVIANETVEHDGRSRQVLVLGTTAEFAPLRDLELRQGAFLPEGPWDRGSPTIVLGGGVARELFDEASPIGAFVRLGGWRMRVAGVIGSKGVNFGIDLEDAVFVPVATALRMFDVTTLSRIPLSVRPGWDMERAVEQTRALLLERHGEEDFTVTTPDAIASALTSILDVLTLALAGIAAISLGVAGVGTMNVMLVAVSERTAEIGLLKAVGANRRQVLALFLAEATLLSGLGGVVGLLLGGVGVWGARRLLPVLPARLVPWVLIAAFALSVVVGIVFGLLPARRAVRMDPVVALATRVR